MNNKLIIFSTCFLLLVSMIFLSVVEKKQADINSKNTWMLYFENAKDSSLNFSIANHSASTNFHWEILNDKDKISEADLTVANGQTTVISVPAIDNATGKKITISVSSNGQTKEIYKIF